jgi:hypothetical protein
MDKVTRTFLATLCIAVGGTALAAPAAMAQSKDQCKGAAYCLPAPKAGLAEKAKTKASITKDTGLKVSFNTQIGSGLVYNVDGKKKSSGGNGGGPPSGLYPIGVLALGCADGCKLTAAPTLKLADGTSLKLPAAKATLGKGGVAVLKVRLTQKQLKQLVAAGGGDASFKISITDEYGTHTDTVKVSVPAPKK